jgi:predicted flap endonuclease-1-like 5' DNA nuclease
MRRIAGALILLVIGVSFGRGLFWGDRPPFVSADSIPSSTAEPVGSSARGLVQEPQRTAPVPPAGFLADPLRFISSAPPESLAMLPGIGPVIADRLTKARTGKRSFTNWEDLLTIKGIGPKKLQRLRALADGRD